MSNQRKSTGTATDYSRFIRVDDKVGDLTFRSIIQR
jgi:hypothetical protein